MEGFDLLLLSACPRAYRSTTKGHKSVQNVGIEIEGVVDFSEDGYEWDCLAEQRVTNFKSAL